MFIRVDSWLNFIHDPTASASGAIIAWNVDFLRGYFCGVAGGFDFLATRPSAKGERISSSYFYDNSIIQQPIFGQAFSRRIKKEAHAGAISRHSTMRHRTAISKRILG